MVPLDRAMVSSHMLSIVTISVSATVWPQFWNAMFLPAAIRPTNVRRITVSYPSVDYAVRHSSVTIACVLTVENRFLSATGSRTAVFHINGRLRSAHPNEYDSWAYCFVLRGTLCRLPLTFCAGT